MAKLRFATVQRSFLDAGEGGMMVTARHVYEGYLDALHSCLQSFCRLGDMPFDPAQRLMDLDADPTYTGL